MNAKDLRVKFFNETGTKWENSQEEPDVDYVQWLENKVLVAMKLLDELDPHK